MSGDTFSTRRVARRVAKERHAAGQGLWKPVRIRAGWTLVHR